MRIDRLTIQNFKGFAAQKFAFHPEFNLLVGANGTGKTTALDALAVALGSWFLGVRGADSRHIRSEEVRLAHRGNGADSSWEKQFPCAVQAFGQVQKQKLAWKRSLNTPDGRTTYKDAEAIKKMASAADGAIRDGQEILLPLISYYGTGRLWQEPREAFQVSDPLEVTDKEEQSRLAGYRNSVDPRLSVRQLTRWIARQSWITFQQRHQKSSGFTAVKQAIINCIESATDLYFDAKLGEVVIVLETGVQPFSNLSDGQRGMLAMVGDMAQKAARLNPHLGRAVLQKTPGVVLIDELDLHLHPRWQRRVIEDLRRTFPKVQFICSSHSPFLIQSLRSGEELIMLDGQPTAELSNLSIEDIALGIQHVAATATSERYAEMKNVATHYLKTLDQAAQAPAQQLQAFKQQLADSIKPYASNPAFQAYLEMKRAAKLGE